MKKLLLILSLLAFTSCVAVGPRCTYTQEGTKLSSWIWFTKEIPVDLSKENSVTETGVTNGRSNYMRSTLSLHEWRVSRAHIPKIHGRMLKK